MSVNDQQGHVPGASSIPKRPSQLSGQQLSNTKRPVAPQKRLMSISKGSTEEPEQSPPLSMGDSLQSNEVDERSSLAEMATMRLDTAGLTDLPRSNTHLAWKKVRVSYPATVNIRKVKKLSFLI